MVRIVSQNFSPQRSRHSSGETDKYLAERASSALGLSVFGKKRFDLPEYESSSDSFWDSELDGEHHDTVYSEHGDDNDDINGNETLKKSNAQSKRKERRRERNKLSAQAYRQRRRSQNMKEQQQLVELEATNKRLHQLVDTLEKKTEQTKQFLRGCSVPMPDILLPSSSNDTAACAAAAPQESLSQKYCRGENSPDSNRHSTPASRPNNGITSISRHNNSPCPRATAPTPPVMSNINHGVKIPSHSHIIKDNNVPGISPVNGQGTDLVNPVPHAQILVNANALIKPQIQASSATTVPTFAAVPALMAIPVEYNTAVTNFNLNSPSQNQRSHIASLAAQNTPGGMDEMKHSLPVNKEPPVMGTLMWSINGNHPPAGTLYSLMNVEMCNNKNIGNNMNSTALESNINGCDNTHTHSGATPSSPVKVNLNEVKISGEPLHFWHAQRNYTHVSP